MNFSQWDSCYETTEAESKARARLMAAAPDLLEALRAIMAEYPRMCADAGMCADPCTLGKINHARAAIAKATGKTYV